LSCIVLIIQRWETEEEVKNYQKKYQDGLYIEKKRVYLYSGNGKGLIQIHDLTPIFERKEISEGPQPKYPNEFQIKKKQVKDETDAVNTAYGYFEEYKQSLNPSQIQGISTIAVKCWQSHYSAVTKLRKIKDPISFVTCSPDKHVKLWSLEGVLFSDINLIKFDEGRLWKFPFD